MYHFHRYSQCQCLELARDFHRKGEDEMVLFELFNWAMHMDEADDLYAVIKPHHMRLYCESRAYE
jgi:predicted urease superfamily metal-dependent hydrolase